VTVDEVIALLVDEFVVVLELGELVELFTS